jgi:hypothetical protein
MPTKPYDLLPSAASDLHRVESAYDAELLVSALLGSVYAVVDPDRAVAVSEFTVGLCQHLRRRDEPAAHLLLAVLETVIRPDDQSPATPRPAAPTWTTQLGQAKVTGTFTYADAYGDHINYLAAFAYPDSGLGGPEHVVSVFVDTDRGTVTTLFVASPADAVLDRLRTAAAEDDTTTFTSIDPARLRAAVLPALAATDTAGVLPEDSSFGTDLAVVRARLATLPETPAAAATSADGTEQISAFRDSKEARRLVGAPGDAAALEFCLDLIQRYSASRFDHDALRWSPRTVRRFMLEWLPQHAIMDATDRALLPRVLDAWARWAGRGRGLPPRSIAETIVAIAASRTVFTTLVRSGTMRSPQADAVARMLAAGIDPHDEEAVGRWLATCDPTPAGE